MASSLVQTKGVKYACNKRDILRAIGMSEDEYNVLQFERAIAWIYHNVWNDAEFANVIIAHPEFKVWWINQWNLREDAFVWEYVGYLMTNDDFSTYLRDAWEKAHDVKYIKTQPPDHVLSACVKLMAKGGKS